MCYLAFKNCLCKITLLLKLAVALKTSSSFVHVSAHNFFLHCKLYYFSTTVAVLLHLLLFALRLLIQIIQVVE